MAANDCLTLDSDTHPADVLEWLAKILEPGHYCQSRDADGKLVLNVEYTGGTMPSGAAVKITKLMVYLEQRQNWNMDFRLDAGGITLAKFLLRPRRILETYCEHLTGGVLVDESFVELLQDKLSTWKGGVLSIFNDRSITFENLSGPFSRLTPIVSPGSTIKSAGKV